ncbi:MAG: hypothetical protein K2P81_05520 [Bacteriovoracaceae bacterium]|nr:hypothetical protein [Bacteriovoracaceae bacterium]
MIKSLILFSLVLVTACSGGTTTGNPITVSLRLVDQQPFAWWKPIKNTILIPEAHAAVSNVYLCFKRLRFKFDTSASSGGSGNIDLTLGRINIDPNGTSLGNINIEAGSYQRIEIDLEKECDGVINRPSVEFTNSTAPFNYSSIDRMTIKFEGNFSSTGDINLDLNIDALLDEMDLITGGDNIKNRLEAVTGDY